MVHLRVIRNMFLLEALNVWHRYRFWSLTVAVLSVFGAYTWSCKRSKRVKPPASSTAKTPPYISESKDTYLWDQKQVQATKVPISKGKILKDGIEGSVKPLNRPKLPIKRVTGGQGDRRQSRQPERHASIQPIVFYFSLTEGLTQKYATENMLNLVRAAQILDPVIISPQVYDLATIDHEDFFEHIPKLHEPSERIRYFYFFLLPSYDIDTVLDNFLNLLKETHNDFRIDSSPLYDLAGYSVFGFGDREGWPTEADGFCKQAIETDKWMAKLTARKRAFPLGLGDVKSDVAIRFGEWADGALKALDDLAKNGSLGEGVSGSGEALESDEEDLETYTNGLPQSTLKSSKSTTKQRRLSMADLEDIGGRTGKSSMLPVDFTSSQQQRPKAMVAINSPTYTALTKQGYTIIGTHSGVKICRWTKSALRGRGSCYKYSFYGIKSHLCMETTPSLSCSNKCVFCWRHGTNPVGTTWRWQVDTPELIFQGAKEGHYKKIKMMRGVPGIRAERFHEAMRIRHCALSLVGEPIFYPHINEFLALLHKEHISSFLVCNAQHPDQLAALEPVTQLYVSIDASNAESLRKIDRPLHRDYWQRFCRCLDILREKRFRMRTVFRLTLVKGFNIDDEVEGYADLVAKGLPCFVEIKGVTYCGTSNSASAGLSMQNVPFYTEVVAFVEALNVALERRGLRYGIAAEHAHSCCALIASHRFFVEGRWHTLINYEKFFACLESREEFSPEDYMGPPTPEWATWGNGGFDPSDQRVDRKGRVIEQRV